MELAEFEALAEPLRRKSAAAQAEYGFALIEGHTATPEEIASVERKMAVALPVKYKAFMMRYGGGELFGFVELFPIGPVPSSWHDLRTLNDREFPERSFVAVASVGTGDHWGFQVIDGHCHEQVWFHFHDAGDDEFVAQDFLEFMASYGLKA
ncbi:SMI1/KNR4 family protein [Micromonospora peucetia]|uniref:SMI1 / KNR4 family (SUKH-1) n=1 Tax=Micromonospora peucetia TaxID=47871 RepID=A0A1C6TYI0_9ACTN|nr:SMI1/KNR4 family protein [Micromonospora peucetia]WSA33133.1 SMI1/KNR4 family protein [Micromonospora peucetia]SCL46846.1 SMI1 / KNR4 family (SUKH-1) [Micromonospora peucetia]